MLHLQHIYANIVVRKNQVLGEDFKMKKIITLAIIASLSMSYTLPVLAIETNKIEKNIKTEKVKSAVNKYDYVNLAWWQGPHCH